MSERGPRKDDVVYLDAEQFVYVDEVVGSVSETSWSVIDATGEEWLVVRAAEKDALLRAAVHDDGRRVAYRVA